MHYKTFDKITILIIVVVCLLFVSVSDSYGLNVEQYQCPEARPMLAYVVNSDGTVRAIVGSSQWGWLFCQKEYCLDNDAQFMESYIRSLTEPKQLIRRIQLP